MKLYSNDATSIYSNYIRITMPYFKQDIPLFILMRALGFISDKEIIKLIVLDLSNIYLVAKYFFCAFKCKYL